ncbi:hypothetical protein C5167_030931 [Papaver somniferum]|nr:hypothetical protein C5167_030931 [Papaver somniferum]
MDSYPERERSFPLQGFSWAGEGESYQPNDKY